MNLESPVEYYYGDTLRWSFGFDNPNKAAVLFVCAVPLLWWLWQIAWKLKPLWLRVPALLAAAGLLLGGWYCLIMTFSRGGLVAAIAGLAYVIGFNLWKKRHTGNWRKSPQLWLSVLLIGILFAGTVWNGLGSRSAEALQKDASVENRIGLWKAALQMSVENPQGFGSEKSGEQYMQWYQPLEKEEGYRTLVNSYLTFLVEQGWLKMSLLLLAFVLFWSWTGNDQSGKFPIALRGAILGFLAAGIFSTTMEDERLWIIPGVCALVLVGNAIYQRRALDYKSLSFAAGSTLIICLVLAIAGLAKSREDTLRREFGTINGSRSVIALGPKKSNPSSLGCLIDEVIVGDQYAKLLRELALKAGVRITLGDQAAQTDHILCMGKEVHHLQSISPQKLLLLAPEKLEASEVSGLLDRNSSVTLIVSEIDEDGRVDFWENVKRAGNGTALNKTALSGVGNRVDWAWEQVIDAVKNGLKS